MRNELVLRRLTRKQVTPSRRSSAEESSNFTQVMMSCVLTGCCVRQTGSELEIRIPVPIHNSSQ